MSRTTAKTQSSEESELIHVFGSALGEDELSEIRDCVDRQWIGMGPKTAALERSLADHLNVDDVVLLNSGSNSLQMAIHLLGIPPGGGAEIILPAFTWVSCASAVLMCGHRPVFCDVDEETMNIDPESVANLVGPRTAGIMAVHYAGQPADMDQLAAFDLPIIEDAAHAIDSKLNGKACGTLGDIGIFSFDSVKNLAMGEGGALVARDPEIVRRARDLRLCGVANTGFAAAQQSARWWKHDIVDAFPKMTPTDLGAAVGLAQFRKLPETQARRAEIWAKYQRSFADLDWLDCPPTIAANIQHSFFSYCVRVRNGQRDALAKYLLDQNIYTTLRFHPLHLSPIYQSEASLPVSEQLSETALNLPMHPRLSDHEVNRVIATVCRFGL